MSKEVDNIIPFPQNAPEPIIPSFVVEEEEDEEENVTLDFENKKAYSVDSTWQLIDPESKEVIMEGKSISGDIMSHTNEDLRKVNVETIEYTPEVEDEVTSERVAAQPVKEEPTFKDELHDIFMNGLASKAIGSLLKKTSDLDRELSNSMDNNRYMGELGTMLNEEVNAVMDKRRKELRACYNGTQVRYENIPAWAKTYVRDYVRDSIHALASVTDN